MSEPTIKKFDIEKIEKSFFDLLERDQPNTGEVLETNSTYTKNAVLEIYTKAFSKSKELLRIAAGVSTIKGVSTVTTTEVE